jgi:hypothetical protein
MPNRPFLRCDRRRRDGKSSCQKFCRIAARIAFTLLVPCGVSACGTPLPAWERHAGDSDALPGDASTEARLVFEPPAPPDAVTRVSRIRVELAQAIGAPRVALVEGAQTAAQLRDLARPSVSQALSARIRPSLAWSAGDRTVDIAPLEPLMAGALYTAFVSDPVTALSFTVAPDDAVAVLPRIWPLADAMLPSSTAVWCGVEAVEMADALEITLPPGDFRGRLTRGTGGSVAAPNCVSWVPAPPVSIEESALPAVTPPHLVQTNGAIALLETAVLWPGTTVPAVLPLSCGGAEQPFGLGCATVEDDRVVVRPPDGAMLWTIDTGEGSVVRQSRGARPFVVRPIAASGHFRIVTLDEGGNLVESEIDVTPAPARAHVVINEVMANPAGSEREQEWIELFNDGNFAVTLAGFTLEIGARTTALSQGVLAPGAFALVVPQGFVEDDGVDPPPAPDTLVLRVATLGGDGLSNEGERIALRDASNAVISTFPAIKTKNGVSIARSAPDALDDDIDVFQPSPDGRATPGARNTAP